MHSLGAMQKTRQKELIIVLSDSPYEQCQLSRVGHRTTYKYVVLSLYLGFISHARIRKYGQNLSDLKSTSQK